MRDEALGIQPELIDRCSRFLDGSCPFRAFVCQKVVELLRRSGPDIDAALRESLAHVGCIDGAVDMGVELRDDATGRSRRHEHPVEVSLADSDVLLVDLKAGRIDAAVLVRPQSGGSSRLVWQDVARQPFVMLAPPAMPMASPQELLQRHGLIRSIDAIVAMVGAGLGVSIVPQPRADAGNRNIDAVLRVIAAANR